jgi:hypothetical protein
MITTTKMEDDLVVAIAQLGKEALAWEKQKDLPKKETYLSNPNEAFLYFLSKMFYTGRPERLAEHYSQAAGRKVEEFLRRHGWQRPPSKDKDELVLKEPTSLNYKFPSADFEMVYGAIEAVSKLTGNNVVRLAKEAIEEGSVSDLYKKITEIHGIKDKLTCLFLRDVASLYDMTGGITGEVTYFLPVDTWVRKLCKKLGVVSEKAKDAEVQSGMVKACKEKLNVSPIDFDHGLWVLSQLRSAMPYFEVIANNLPTMRTLSESSLLRSSLLR